MSDELFTRDPFGNLIPATETAREMVKRMPKDGEIWVTVRRARKGWMHRKYFALLHFAYNHMGEDMSKRWPSFDAFRKMVLINTGHYEMVDLGKGRVAPMPHSMKFGRMSQEDFERLYDDTIKFLCGTVIPATEDEVARQMLAEGVMEFAA